MAIGSRYNAGADNYLSMANQADQAAINEAKGMVSLFESGYSTMSKMKDRLRLDEARQAFETAWSSGNPEDVQRVIARFPEYGAQLQKALGVRDEQNRQQMGSLAIQLSGMLESGNIEGAQTLLRNNPALFDKQGMFSAESVADAIGRAATGTDADSAKRFGMWKDWAQKLSLSILKPNEIMNYGLSQQQMAQQLEMQKNALEQQLQIANQNLEFRWSQMGVMQDYRDRLLGLKRDELSAKQGGPKLDVKDINALNDDITQLDKNTGHTITQLAAENLNKLRASDTATDQLAAIFSFAKALDPTSVVREGEQAMMQRTDGVFGTIANYANQIRAGERLNDKQMQQMQDTAKLYANTATELYNSNVDDYLNTYKGYIPEEVSDSLKKRKGNLLELKEKSKDEGKPKGLIHPTVQGMAEASGYTSPSGVPYKVK